MDGPLIVQGDASVLLEVAAPGAGDAREQLARFAELVKAPEHVHTYRITPLSVWNAAAAGMRAEEMVAALRRWSRYQVPPAVIRTVNDLALRFGRVALMPGEDGLIRVAADSAEVHEALAHDRLLAPYFSGRTDGAEWLVPEIERGRLKRALAYAGWPAVDHVGYIDGVPLGLSLREDAGIRLRHYQEEATASFLATGEGVVVLPCGAGKTVVGMAVMARLGMRTLILVTSVTAAQQWRAELLDKTDLESEKIGLYTGRSKEIRPVTVATYQVLTHRTSHTAEMPHLGLLRRQGWGLVIYDEVHVLPAPVFQTTSEIQARRRLGLSATLVREDGLERDVFALVGPKRYDVPWKELEIQGWIAAAHCVEIRVPVSRELRMAYARAPGRARPQVAADNPQKRPLVERLLSRHRGLPVLIIGTYVSQLEALAAQLGAPILTGKTGQRRRDRLFADFRSGTLKVLVVSKVANYAVDLPDAAVAIQVSGSFGSRQEEAQRLGRILRPKSGKNQAHFYALVSQDTVEQDFAERRHLFLAEQGYEYEILTAKELTEGADA
ncbi:MAG: DEAD/DEAH box helicase [Acidobacteria bacterium]|nr:DEAD/DEAH box helicase [Acidobacteriota bacterium]